MVSNLKNEEKLTIFIHSFGCYLDPKNICKILYKKLFCTKIIYSISLIFMYFYSLYFNTIDF